jgi:ElaB/YqjD/DUF883 family membrane-anchored ribosome-binding protein
MEAANRVDTEQAEQKAKLEGVIERAKEVCERLQTQTAAAARAAGNAVREHPYQAVGIAFGVGVLIGVLMMWSRRD